MSKRTRFFAAAAVTNTALAELFSRFGVHLFVSRFTSEFLASVGYLLEHMNMEWARRISVGAIEADDFDWQMIAAEQTAVQNCLTRLHHVDGPGYVNTVVEIDRVLSFAGCVGSPGKSLSGLTTYATILRHAADRLGRSASFAVQNDRETIGRMLVRHLRGVAIGITRTGVSCSCLAPWTGYHLYYPHRRQSSPPFALLVDALRYRS